MANENINKVLGSKNYDVNVITTTDGEKINGQIATWVTQVSEEPALIALCLAPTRYTYELLNNSKVLAVNMLSKDQTDLVTVFGYQSGRDANKFDNVQYKPGTTGSPIIDGVAAYLECKVRDIYEGGDHQIILADVVEGNIVKGGERLSYQWLISQ